MQLTAESVEYHAHSDASSPPTAAPPQQQPQQGWGASWQQGKGDNGSNGNKRGV
ncbi:hypothetical protein [Streptomyces sp. KL116D]